MEIEPIMFPWLIARLSRGGMRCAPREELASGSKREARSPLGMSKSKIQMSNQALNPNEKIGRKGILKKWKNEIKGRTLITKARKDENTKEEGLFLNDK